LLFKLNRQRLSSHRRRDERQTILEFNRSLTLIADPDALMASIAARIKELFGADRLLILLELSESGVFTVVFSTGYRPDETKSLGLEQRDRLAKWLLTNETPLIIAGGRNVRGYLSEAEREMLERLGVRVCLPLMALNRLTGLMMLSSSNEAWNLDQEDLNLLEMLTSQASIAFENAYLFQEQRDRLRRLYRAERLAAAGQLAASVAHEIRNPLTAIRSTIQYLVNEFAPENPKRLLIEGVIGEVDRINRTIDGLLSLTRRPEFKPDRLDLSSLLEQSLLLLRAQAQSQDVEIQWSAPAPNIQIIGDVSQLKQVFLNLMLNAMQAMPGGGSLKVDLTTTDGAAGSLRDKPLANVSIVDSGCGIPAENIDMVFDPFFTTKQGGTGLGLSTSYAIIRQHGGELEISSREGEGTSVHIRFPLIR
jgi:two-component system, NtrC family, sensor kinase